MDITTIGHLLWGLEMGGVQRMIAVLATRGPVAAHHVVFAFHDGPARPILERAGCAARVIPKRGPADFSVIGRLSRAMLEEQVEILHAHDFTGLFWGGLAARRAGGLPMIATEHLAARKLGLVKRTMYFRHLRRCAGVIVLSKSTRARFLQAGIEPQRLALCPLGPDKSFFAINGPDIEARRRLGIDGGTFAVLTCSRLEPHKNIALLIRVAHALRSGGRKAVFLVAGDGGMRGELEAMAGSFNLKDTVRFLGFRPDVEELLSAADIFALPSRLEELPLGVLEAMAAGLPVLAAPAGALPEFLPGEAGMLLPPDDAAGWAAAVTKLASDAAMRRRMGEAARALVRARFDLDAGIAGVMRVYGAALGA